ncbi:MAG: PHP domain-containing protein [Thermoplasmata archaeon]
MKVDMHVHTMYSLDSDIEIKILMKAAKKFGFGVGIVDHNSIKGGIAAQKMAKEKGVVIVPGIEVSTKEGHVIGYNLTENIPPGLSAVETVERIHGAGGFVVIPHPFRMVSGVGSIVKTLPCEGIEVQNSRNNASANQKARDIAELRKKGISAGSDAHSIAEVGSSYIVVNAESSEDVLECILKGNVEIHGRSRGAKETAILYGKMLYGYVKRGFRRL